MIRTLAVYLAAGVFLFVVGFADAASIDYFIYDDWGGSWADAEKNTLSTEDDKMCWAAAASNILEWAGWTGHNEGEIGNTDQMFGYFQNHWTDAGTQIVDSPSAVDFEEGFGSNNLPGGNSIVPKFETTRSFLALSPAPKRGVGVSEQVGIIFDLQTSQDINDILSDLETKEFRVGLHVISFINGKSESFINDIPEPITVALLGLGGLLIRRKK